MVEYTPLKNILEQKNARTKAYKTGICLGPHALRAIKKFITSQPTSNVLVDLGAGGGHFSHWLLSTGFRQISCVDIDNYLVYDKLKKKFCACDLSTKRLPFKDNTIDGIIAIEVIEHLENAAHCLREVARVLKPGGWFLMTIPNIANARRRLNFLLTGDNLLISEANDHLQNITPALLFKLVRASFGTHATIYLLRYPVVFPLFHFTMPHVDLLADNRMYIIRKPSKTKSRG